MAKNLDALLKKREKLEAEIAAAQVAEKRKIAVMAMPEFVNILAVPDSILRTAFIKIATENISQN